LLASANKVTYRSDLMSLRIYNTLTRQKEPFETLQPGQVTMYVCGPTVYDKAHVGHAMSVLFSQLTLA